MQLTKRLAALGLALLACVLVPVDGARADEASGTWTGHLELRGNYYWETSTRVIAPEVRARVTSPDGIDVSAGYLVDAITSASIAAGVVQDIRFTEVRHQGNVGVGRELDLGDAQLRLDLTGRMSHEPDYLATGLNLTSTLSWNERATSLTAYLGYIHDDVGAVIRSGAAPTTGTDGRNLSDRGRVGQLEGINTGLSLYQVISPVAWISVSYDLIHNWGFLANPYRSVMVEGVLRPEVHPDARTRQALSGRLAYFFEPTRTAFHLMYRSYLDGWDIGAINPEVRVYQEIGPSITLRARYRYYQQTRSFFFRSPDQYRGEDPFVTADPKMSAFESHMFGLRALVALDVLRNTPLEFVSGGHFDMSFDYLLQTSRFGNGVLAQVGLDVPF